MELITDDELLSLGGFAGSLGSIALADRTAARESASSVTLSYLRKRYGLPLVSWSDDVRRATAAIAAWDLVTLRGYNPSSGRDQVVAERAREARDWLTLVAKGDVEPEAVEDSTASVLEQAPLVGSLGLRGWGGDDGERLL